MKYIIGFLVACIVWAVALYNTKIPEYTIIIDRSNCIQEPQPMEERKQNGGNYI